MSDSDNAPVGQPRIPGYDIIREVGRGGVAAVYLAVQRSLQRKVALKVMSPALTADPTFTDRFMREGRTIAKLNHPGIVTIHEFSVIDYHHYIAMEYLEGGSLKQRINEGLSVDQVLGIMYKIAAALEYAHANNIVHRDVKPENIMFRDAAGSEVVLTDFGIAKSDGQHTQLTSAGMVVGTPRYMSPEQAVGKGANAQSDIYALGVIFYELLTGEPPYGAKESIAVLYSHINDPIPKLPENCRSLQPLLEDMLAKKPRDRIKGCGELRKRIEGYQITFAEAGSDPGQRIDTPIFTTASPALKKGLRTAAWYLFWGGVAVVSVLIISTVKWDLFESPVDVVTDELPLGEGPSIVTPTKIDLTETEPVAPPDLSLEAVPYVAPNVFADTFPQAFPDASSDRGTQALSESDIEALLKLAERQIARNQLSKPAGNNALDTYRAVLVVKPDSVEATQGLLRIANKYTQMARGHLNAGEPDAAAIVARTGLSVWSNYEPLQTVMRDIKQEQANRIAEEDNRPPVVKQYIDAASSGHTKSQLQLALAYGNGLGVAKDPDKAIHWFRQAANGDHPAAQYNLALGLLFGPQPAPQEAAEWLLTLADNKYEPAYRILGWMYTTGTGVARNAKQAIRFAAKGTSFGSSHPRQIVSGWQQAFEREYYESIGKVRDEKLTRTTESLK